MAEGRTKASYQSDLITAFNSLGATVPAEFTIDVPNNLFLQAEFGYVAAPAGQHRLPKRLKPRHVVGATATGRKVRANVATTAATLWTGAASTWTYIDNFGATQTATVTGRVGEAATM